MSNDRSLRCPLCGGSRLDVTRTEHDEDGLVIRIRQCVNCKVGKIATEERRIPLDAFFPRANSHIAGQKALYRKAMRTCRICGGQYRGGSYSFHVATRAHLRHLSTAPTAESRRNERLKAKRRYWNERGFNLSDSDLRAVS